MDADFDAREAQLMGLGHRVSGLLRGGHQITHRMVGIGARTVAPCHVDVLACGDDFCSFGLLIHLLNPLCVVLLRELGQHPQLPDRGHAIVGPGSDGILFESVIVHCHMDMGVNKTGQDGIAAEIYGHIRISQVLAHSGNRSSFHKDVHRDVVPIRVQQDCIFQKCRH